MHAGSLTKKDTAPCNFYRLGTEIRVGLNIRIFPPTRINYAHNHKIRAFRFNQRVHFKYPSLRSNVNRRQTKSHQTAAWLRDRACLHKKLATDEEKATDDKAESERKKKWEMDVETLKVAKEARVASKDASTYAYYGVLVSLSGVLTSLLLAIMPICKGVCSESNWTI